MKRGMFITFEGVEGCGKSTQIARLQQHLETRGHSVVVTREPGGTPIAEAIRALLLDPLNHAMSPVTELLLYEAARAQHVAERIRPALDNGFVVLCDRFADSTTAYQGAGRGLSPDVVGRLHDIATQGLHPDLTIVLDVPADVGLSRATQTGSDRMELEALEFHERVRIEFLRLAKEEPARVIVIDGMQDVDAVADAIRALVDARLEAP
jgi:dTMP kinase